MRPRRWATRWWWLSTGMAGRRRQLNSRVAALVFGPTPGRLSSQVRAAGMGISARKSRAQGASVPQRWLISRSTAWMRGAFCSGQVQARSACCTAAVGASRTASQVGKAARSSW